MTVSVQDTMEWLKKNGYMEAGLEVEEASTPELPWFVKIITAVGAWLATLCFIAFYFFVAPNEMAALRDGMVMAVIGVGLIIGMYFINPIHEFSMHLRISVSILGQVFLFIGLNELLPGTDELLLAIGAVELLLLLVYQQVFLKFAAIMTLLVAYWIGVERHDWSSWIHLPVLMTAAGAAFVILREPYLMTSRWAALSRALGYALSTALLLQLMPSSPVFDMANTQVLQILHTIQVQWWISGACLAAVLLISTYVIIEQLDMDPLSAGGLSLLGAALAVSLLGVYAPGLSAAVLIMLLSFHRGMRFLLGLCLAYAVVYSGSYLYAMSWSLMAKSLVMLVAAAVFLSAATVFSLQHSPGEGQDA